MNITAGLQLSIEADAIPKLKVVFVAKLRGEKWLDRQKPIWNLMMFFN
jgi:hypothetical protein